MSETLFADPAAIEETATMPAPPPAESSQGSSVLNLMQNRKRPTPVMTAAPQAPTAPTQAEPTTITKTPQEAPTATPKPKPEELRSTAETTAEMWTMTMNLGLGKICGAISGGDGSRFQLTEKEQTNYKKICVPYFMEQGAILTPTQMFYIATATMFGGAIYSASTARKEETKKAAAVRTIRQTTQRKQEAHTTRARGEQLNELFASAPTEDIREVNREAQEARQEAGPLRQRFEVDKDGLYTQHHATGRPVKKALRVPPEAHESDLVAKWSKRVLRPASDREAMSWGEANEEIRLALYGHREAVKN